LFVRSVEKGLFVRFLGSKILATIIYWVNVIALLIFIGLHSIDRRRKVSNVLAILFFIYERTIFWRSVNENWNHISFGLYCLELSCNLFFIFYIIWFATLAGSHLRVLSTRFQSHENIATTRLITPVMIVLHFCGNECEKVHVLHFCLPDLGGKTVVTTKTLEEVIIFAPSSEYQYAFVERFGTYVYEFFSKGI
uniref:XK-related protein n=1 Tax=Angiostrongylus cantonensis TaxID=6313 RepID=A0A0K0CZV3_ANGCA